MATAAISDATVEEIIDDWPSKRPGQQQRPEETARKMIDRYGTPDEATPDRLVWHDNGPWKRTEVYRDGPKHNFPIPHVDHLAQTIDYRVPPEKHDELAAFDGSVYPDRTRGELTAICHEEEANVLALNLAHDVVTDGRTPDRAREEYARIMTKLMAGASPQATQEFQFQLPSGDQGDPDVTIVREEVRQRAPRIGAGLLGVAALVALYVVGRRTLRRKLRQRRRG